ncbi:hypothetical protein [Pseudomonas aeruginosa]|uniref:Uncharacterized protein n=1 Tax=Pseudomonas aeruginosa TaxID=287 RepID=A0A2C9WYC4_PSEAI|nr:hypothetical protein [Pseudomonas aeruginosa]EIU3787340.1 hypothetical protein [Pseudomonas aeruginosa]EKV0487497.1 hypothetical protein [Pseudomonas aeruginosa]MBG3901723.1 hypothetical protein [Pseudomonas aeruginosa]MBV5727449.1 hypothetical protein [Pseudomonas aeruginosa]MDA3152254.1 hypothetical protein [Pseudomonas aeruginosa]
MAVLVILDANPDEPEDWRFLKADEYDGTGHWDDNRTFPTAAAADAWIQKHARIGWCTMIVGEDDE